MAARKYELTLLKVENDEQGNVNRDSYDARALDLVQNAANARFCFLLR